MSVTSSRAREQLEIVLRYRCYPDAFYGQLPSRDRTRQNRVLRVRFEGNSSENHTLVYTRSESKSDV